MLVPGSCSLSHCMPISSACFLPMAVICVPVSMTHLIFIMGAFFWSLSGLSHSGSSSYIDLSTLISTVTAPCGRLPVLHFCDFGSKCWCLMAPVTFLSSSPAAAATCAPAAALGVIWLISLTSWSAHHVHVFFVFLWPFCLQCPQILCVIRSLCFCFFFFVMLVFTTDSLLAQCDLKMNMCLPLYVLMASFTSLMLLSCRCEACPQLFLLFTSFLSFSILSWFLSSFFLISFDSLRVLSLWKRIARST